MFKPMRSYYSHLGKTDPVLRSSAIFPLFLDEEITTRLIFLGYWLLKRKIETIKSQVTIRETKGKILKQFEFLITEPKAYRIEVKDHVKGPLIGSIEIEFFSETDLVFPYPAVTVNYYGKNFSTVVHTAERTYNNQIDASKNEETHVPESGFDIYADGNREPFITLINGNEQLEKQNLLMNFYNSNNEKLSLNLNIEAFEPYETRILFPIQEFELHDFFQNKAGTCKIHFHLKGVFPRLLVGNLQTNPFAQVITHTYYDCTETLASSNFWEPIDPNWHEASLMLPFMGKKHQTLLSFYPIFAPSPFSLDLEIYNNKGEFLGSFTDALKFESKFDQYLQIDLKDYYPCDENLAVRVIARASSQVPIPARIKIAIDIGIPNNGLPCNICTNLQPYVPAFSNKKTSFKWAPILADQPKGYAFLMNSSPKKQISESTEISLTFYREKDTQILQKTLSLPPQGFYVIDPELDSELNLFLEKSIGWFTALSTNPYLTTYYFAENPSGVIGGDHGY